MSAVPAHSRDTLRPVAAGALVEGHGEDPGHRRPERYTGATSAPPLPEAPFPRRLAELAAALRKAAMIAETLSGDAEIRLAGSRGQSVMDDVSEVVPPKRAQPKTSVEESLLTVADLAVLLRLDERTVRRMRTRGSLPPAIDLGSVLRWRKSDIDAWLDARGEGVVA